MGFFGGGSGGDGGTRVLEQTLLANTNVDSVNWAFNMLIEIGALGEALNNIARLDNNELRDAGTLEEILASPALTSIILTDPIIEEAIRNSTIIVPYIVSNSDVMTIAAENAEMMNFLIRDANVISVLLSGDTAMPIVLSSTVGMAVMTGSTTAMNAMFNNAVWRTASVNSSNAMTAIAANTVSMNALLANVTARDLVLGNPAAFSIMIASQTAVSAMARNRGIMTEVNNNAVNRTAMEASAAVSHVMNELAVEVTSPNNNTTGTLQPGLCWVVSVRAAINSDVARTTSYFGMLSGGVTTSSWSFMQVNRIANDLAWSTSHFPQTGGRPSARVVVF